MLSVCFSRTLQRMGISRLEHPIFYHAPIGIRFAIGGKEEVYKKGSYMLNPAYIDAALERAGQIYRNLPSAPDLLCIDICPEETGDEEGHIADICRKAGLPKPHESCYAARWEDGEEIYCKRLFWDLCIFPFQPESLLKKIIEADIGGIKALVSSVYFVDTQNAALFHLYDDRGADLIASDKETLRPVFDKFENWILEYDREKIEGLFRE